MRLGLKNYPFQPHSLATIKAYPFCLCKVDDAGAEGIAHHCDIKASYQRPFLGSPCLSSRVHT
jgi:hypothetical protein